MEVKLGMFRKRMNDEEVNCFEFSRGEHVLEHNQVTEYNSG